MRQEGSRQTGRYVGKQESSREASWKVEREGRWRGGKRNAMEESKRKGLPKRKTQQVMKEAI